MPHPATRRSRRVLRWLAWLFALLTLIGATLVALGLREAVQDPQVRRATLSLPGWPASAPPIRVALLSDIHIGNRAMRPERLEAIVAQVNAARPDLILIAGDFVNGHKSARVAAQADMLRRPLSRFKAPLGVFAVLGNHDHWTDPAAVRAALAQAGVRLLSNQAVRRGGIVLLGIDDAFSGHADVARALDSARGLGGVPVVLSHTPDLAHQLPVTVPLLLAGHTHCGQVALPWGRQLVPRSPYANWRPLYDPHYRCGLARDPGRTVVVTAGLGSGTSPIRLDAPPDWWLLALGP